MIIDPNDRVLLEQLARFAAQWLEKSASEVTEGDVWRALEELRAQRDLAAAQSCLNGDHDEIE